MSIRRTAVTFVAAALGALPLIACGSDRAGLSTAPTSVQPASLQTSGATPRISPFDTGRTGENESEPVDGEAPVTSLVAGTSCPTLSFMIGQYKISVTGTTTFEGGACADIKPGARLEVKGVKTGLNIVASKIEFKNDDRNGAEPVEGEGIITALKTGTTCPTLTFLIDSKQISVTTSTMFEHGTCADLIVGRRVHVKGTMSTGGAVVATSIDVQSESPGHPVAEGDGRVTSLVSGTSCPSLQFKIEEWTVTLDASTVFTGGVCGDIAVGKKLGVKGTVTAEHQVLATKIVFKANGDN